MELQYKVVRIAAAILVLFVVVCGCQTQAPKEQDLVRIQSVHSKQTKKVIVFAIDSIMAQSIDRGIQQNRLPTFRYLIEHGQYYKNLVSSFPTMSVTIDSSLLTGRYADEHRIPGLVWYSAADRKVINYGTGPMEVLRHGAKRVITDALFHLNGSHLNKKLPTIYDELSNLGYTSGSINGLIYRGKTDHTISIPAWIQAPSSLPKRMNVKGPDFMSLGVLSNPLKGMTKLPGGLTDRLGLNNAFAIDTASYLVRTKTLPDFLFVYLPDLDQKLHRSGPSEMEGVEKVDRQLERFLQSFGSPEQALREAVIILIGDSGMTSIVPASKNPVIDLPALLGEFRILNPGEEVSQETEIVLAVNETMAYVYPLRTNRSLQELAGLIMNDPRIDFAAWKEKEWIHVMQGSDDRRLQFKANGSLKDKYNQKWTINQEGTVLDLKVDSAKRTLHYGQYPDALKRLSGALNSHDGNYLVVTAKPGYELADRSSPTHKGGGGHGSLNQMESLVPIIISGSAMQPEHLRIVDLKAYLLNLVTSDEKTKQFY